MAKFPIGIIYILRDKFQVYIPNFPSILEFRFLPEFIRDLDVVNKELLFNLLDLFIKNSKIPPTSFIIVIADSASIIKDFLVTPAEPSLEEAKKQSDEFIEHIPFEEVASKTIPIQNGIQVYATNKDLYQNIKEFLMHIGSEVIYVLPGRIIGPELHPSLDINGINAILKKYPDLKEYDLTSQHVLRLTTDKKENHEEKEEEKEIEADSPEVGKNEKKSDKKRTIILVAIFVILLTILIIVYLTQPSI